MGQTEDNITNAIRYRLAANRSRFIVRAFAAGLFAGFGHNPTIAICDFTGAAGFVSQILTDAWLQVTVNAESLVVVDQMKEKDRHEIENTMRQQSLETTRYPEINYVSRNITAQSLAEGHYRAQITGELTLHGITQSQAIVAQITISGDELRAQGEFTLRQSKYRIKPVSVGMGALKLKDELQFSFDIVAQREAVHNA